MTIETAHLSGHNGLSAVEAAARLARDGPNLIVPEARSRRWRRVLGPLSDPMVALLLIAAPTYLLIGETADAIVAFVALVPIAAVGWLLEARAERTLARLRRLTAPTATVVRDGAAIDIPAQDIVVGDRVGLKEGDIVPADAMVLDATQLLLDESSLTGESLPVDKTGADGDRAVWAGTTVVSGRAVIEVTRTGAATRYGGIGALVADARQPSTPLQHALVRLVRALAVVAAVFCTAVVIAELLHGDGWGDAVIAGVSLAIAAIPEEFSMVYALYLALGAWRLTQHRALVRRLPSVETLGSTTVICVDKTGTLTIGKVAVGDTWARQSPSTSPASGVRMLLEYAVLACEPEPFDPLDVAIVHHAAANGIDTAALHGGELVGDWPFDTTDKYVTHVWRHDRCRCRVAAKGAIEGLLLHSHSSPDDRRSAMEVNASFAARGMRVIAVAGGEAPRRAPDRRRDEEHLRFLGLIAFDDPVRDGVADALAQCRHAGIRVIMLTGDHPETAHAIAEGIALPHERAGVDVIASGDELDRADPDRVEQLVSSANVFARVLPEHKHQLVQALRRRGEVVAMTGDGINDAPALREADIGVAMGERGTDVAREASSLVLLDDNFATIVAAVRDGRRIFDNLTHAFAYLIAFHPPLLLAALVVPLLDRPLMLLPVHLVALEILLHPVVSLVFQADPPAPDVMQRPPRPVAGALRLRALWRPYLVGGVLAAAIILEYLLALRVGWPAPEARALAFTTLLAAQPFLILGMRSPERSLWAGGRPWTRTLTGVTALVAVVTVAVVEFAPLARVLELAPFPPEAWLVVVATAALATTWSEPLKRSTPPPVRGHEPSANARWDD
jgi:Ca2+-transporting ATPase